MQIKNISPPPRLEIELRKKVKSKMKNLEEFDIAMRKFGNFGILDSDPLKLEISPAVYRHDFSTARMYGEKGERFGSHNYYPATKRDAYLELERPVPHLLPRSWSTKDIFIIIFHRIITIRLLHGKELYT